MHNYYLKSVGVRNEKMFFLFLSFLFIFSGQLSAQKLEPLDSLSTLMGSDSEFKKLKEIVKNDNDISFVKEKALATIKEGFDAGNGYNDQVFIRDYNTFIELSLSVHSRQRVSNNLLVFFKMQGENGEILDVVMPKRNLHPEEKNLKYRSKLAPEYAGDKATVETDQESSLIQAVYKYIKKTDDYSILTDVSSF